MVVKSSELRTGDVVECHGMRVLIDRPINSRVGNHAGLLVYWTCGKVLNRADVSPDSVPLSFTRHEGETDHRWTVQGNDLAHWYLHNR